MIQNTSASFRFAHFFTAQWEGGISYHKNDKGGYTAYGISTTFYKSLAATAAGAQFLASLGLAPTAEGLRAVTKELAAAIFHHEFWQKLKLDEATPVAGLVIYDAAVNCGHSAGVRFFQRGYNETVKIPLAVDGLIGPKTLAAAAKAGARHCLRALAHRRAHYHAIVEKNPKQKVFLKGWLNRVANLGEYLETY